MLKFLIYFCSFFSPSSDMQIVHAKTYLYIRNDTLTSYVYPISYMDWQIIRNESVLRVVREGGDYLDGYMILKGDHNQSAVARFTYKTVIIAYTLNLDDTFITETIEYEICKK